MASKRSARKQMNPIQRFMRETTGELRKVSWPTRDEALNLTRIVLIVIVIASSLLALLDVLFSRLFALILGS